MSDQFAGETELDLEEDIDDLLLPDDAKSRIEVSIGALTVEVEGEELEDVSDVFDEKFERALRETGEMADALREARGYY